MGVPSGLGASVGFAKEATYGTYVAPSLKKFVEFTSETMNLNRAYIMSQGLRGGRLFQAGPRRSPTTRSAAGNIVFEVPNQKFGWLIDMMHGETIATAQIGTTGAYKQVHKVGTTDSFAKSKTLEIGKPLTTGTVQGFRYVGSVLTQAEFDIQLGGFFTCTASFDARDEEKGTVVSPAYDTGIESFNFVQTEIKVEGTKLEEARGAKIGFGIAKDTGRFYLGNEKKAVPLTNQFMSGTVTLTQDYGSNTIYEYFAKGEKKKLEVILTGGEAAGGEKYKVKFTFPQVGFDGDSPNVAGPAILQQNVPLVVLDNGSEAPMEVEIVSLDKEAEVGA